MMRYMKKEKKEQFRRAKEDGAFEMQAGREALVRAFQRVVNRHCKRE